MPVFATRIRPSPRWICAAVFCCLASSTRTLIFPNCACSADWGAPCWTGWSPARYPKRREWRITRTPVAWLKSSCTRWPRMGPLPLWCSARTLPPRRQRCLKREKPWGCGSRRRRPELHQTPERAYRESRLLIDRFHRRGRLVYAVTPRFALSTSEAMLEVCQTLLREHAGLLFQTHLNENDQEIAKVARLFPWASDYLAVYERFGLSRPSAVMAHDVHPTDSELDRLASTGAAVAHCPSSNAALGSGLFPMKRHRNAGVRCALGTDVGGGTGFGMLKEALQAYLLQRVAPDGILLDAGHLLYLATLAGAEALGLSSETGDFRSGKSADFVYLRPPAGSPLAAVLEREQGPERVLAAIFTLAGAESVREVRVEGSTVYRFTAPEGR